MTTTSTEMSKIFNCTCKSAFARKLIDLTVTDRSPSLKLSVIDECTSRTLSYRYYPNGVIISTCNSNLLSRYSRHYIDIAKKNDFDHKLVKGNWMKKSSSFEWCP
jgi:hypothetical protein